MRRVQTCDKPADFSDRSSAKERRTAHAGPTTESARMRLRQHVRAHSSHSSRVKPELDISSRRDQSSPPNLGSRVNGYLPKDKQANGYLPKDNWSS